MVVSVTTTVKDVLSTATGTSLVFIALVTLAALLIQKEATSGISSSRARRWRSALDIAIIPLTIVLILTIILKFADIYL